MRLHRLTLTAFGPFGGTQHIDFDALSCGGLFLLHGPTGAGKTAILDGVCFALYGSVPGARQQAPGGLRSDHAEPDTATEIVLELTLGGRRLEVTRRPERERPKKRGTGTTTERAYSALRERTTDGAGGTWRALSRSHQEIGEELGQLLGMNREQFCQVVLLPQGDFARFLRAGAEDRAKLLGRLFDTRRFAAVEQRLAERRQEAAAGVRDGDDRLRSLTDRLRQAAGAGDPAEPEEDVLSWAAQLRSLAREQRDIAAEALHAAEAGHTRAQRAFARTTERVRRAERLAEARRRAERWDGMRAERERTGSELAAARAAAAVAPALRLRENAEAEHRAAAAAAGAARAGLPEPLREATADRLAAEERTVRGHLGALTAARQAEDRAGRLATELETLAGEEHEDAELLAETAGWLERFGGEREELARQLAAAEAARTSAGHRTGTLADTEHRLDAARRRAALADRIGAAEKDELLARETAAGAYEEWLELKERRLRGMAAELAAELRAGEPCAVCGATEHPHPAAGGPDPVSPQDERAAEEAHRAASAHRERTSAALAALREAHAAADAAAGEGTVPGLTRALAALEDEQRVDLAMADTEEEVRGRLAAAERRHAERQALHRDIERRIAARTSRERALRTEREGLLAEIHAARGEASTVADRAAELSALAQALAGAAETVRRAGESAQRWEAARTQARDAAHRAGFPGPQEAAEAVRSAEHQRSLERRLNEWRTEEAAIVALLADAVGPAGSDAADVPEAADVPRQAGARRPGPVEEPSWQPAAGGTDGTAPQPPGGPRRAGAAASEAADGAGSTVERTVASVPGQGRRPQRAAERDGDEARRPATPRDRRAGPLPGQAREVASAPARTLTEAVAEAARHLPGAGDGPADPVAVVRRALDAATVRLREAAAADSAARTRCRELDALSARLATQARALAPVREEAARIARLAGLAAGTAAENTYRMRLETYVLAARLEQVAEAAGSRLYRMSAGRYQLAHSDSKAGRGRSGLGLHVLDAWTGRPRDTATLSGGESFFVSLALALGLADVVAAEAGGQRLDTLFIDEGFGSLDEQSLDEVLDVLDSLREQDRAVGIVSHVPDLRTRIPTQLEVLKTARGSTVRKTG
ncbi:MULTISPECIES: AAA family ATPase [unclassified Streptomyces]|uniref:AAA family ATPase n=1 Tax=unclassified Streptomyces TaxID=2593676 RepID=UPI0019063BC2|nr:MULTISPECIES: SMC family ATPase [unclassified Streptomyces]MCU4749860.1 SMC family ATPase [Streptomyces sp. G-5]QQN76154.1 SMC family ATPase [Streptomyces sp. XC 2026]